MSLWARYSDSAAHEAEPTLNSIDYHISHSPDCRPLPLDARNDEGQGIEWQPRRLSRVTKRGIDVSLALILLVVFAPVVCLVAVVIRMSGPGPVVFKHARVGRWGRIFPCFKFRTMHADAPERLRALLASDAALARQWADRQKLDWDPRVTNVGRILRETSLDELPQLINVLRGDMSLVGPRPVTPAELQRYGSAAALYLQVRPGLTGLWQVSGRNLTSYDSRVQLDRDYVANWRLSADLRILARTPKAVLLRRGAS